MVAVTFTIDKTLPMITASAKANGVAYTSGAWTKYDVVVSFTCSDNGSGLAAGSPPADQTLSAEGAGQSATATCTDKAGNTATATFSGINIDKVPPQAPTAQVLPAPNAAGWNNALPVSVAFTGIDNLSGIAACTAAPAMTAETAGTVLTGSCTDKAGNTGSTSSVTLKIDVTLPDTTNLVTNPVAIGVGGSMTATVTDPQSGGTASGIGAVQFNIDGGGYSAATVAAGSSLGGSNVNVATNLPSYSTTGVHTICVRGTDTAGNVGKPACSYYAVYDASAGFVTGGGWIMSNPGAYTPDPKLTGKANFGFVSKYQKGATIPTGQTEFQFQTGNLNFHSTSYQWLVVSGPMAQYKGSGTINGTGNYQFLLTARDGRQGGGGGIDGFRLKIMDGTTVVYDNMIIADESMTSANVQALGGGSVQIQSK